VVGQEAGDVAEVLAVDLPDLELGQEQVREREGRAGSAEPAPKVDGVRHPDLVDHDVDRPATVRMPEVQPLRAVDRVEQLLRDVSPPLRGRPSRPPVRDETAKSRSP
jgi:hypothetical protein